jgi:hypothetical protein
LQHAQKLTCVAGVVSDLVEQEGPFSAAKNKPSLSRDAP